jgi:peptide/nickel transport system substrate-binding protein
MNYLLKAISLGAVMAAGLAIAEPSGTFRQAHDYGFGEKSSLDPSSPGRIQWITEKIMNRLVSPDLAGIPEADLATEWSANAEATEWTFKLREGVTFHDGSTLDAADVIYTFERILDPDGTSPARSALKMIESVSAVDDMTVKMTLNTPFADMPLQLMDYRMRIIPDGSGDMIGETGIGTGPFKVEKYEADGTTVLVANLDYYKGAPKLARMEIIAISEGQARIQAFLGGQTDMYRYVTAQERVLLDRSDKYNVQVIPTGNWRGLVFRTDVEPFTDARVRKAVRLAADRQEIVAGPLWLATRQLNPTTNIALI